MNELPGGGKLRIRRRVVGRNDVVSESGEGCLALSELHDGKEVGEDLDVVEAGVVDLNVASASLDLRSARSTRHGARVATAGERTDAVCPVRVRRPKVVQHVAYSTSSSGPACVSIVKWDNGKNSWDTLANINRNCYPNLKYFDYDIG